MSGKELITLLKQRPALLVFAASFLLTLVLYWRMLFVGFLSDDYHMLSIIRENMNMFSYFTTNIVGERGGSSYGPIFNALTIVQYWLFGLSSVGYHLVLLLFHAATATMLYLTVNRLTRSRGLALSVAVLFVFIQSHTGSLAWIAVLPHIAATCFLWISLYNYLVYLQDKKALSYGTALVFFALSLFTKEIIITSVALFCLLHVLVEQKKLLTIKQLVGACIRILPFLVITGVYLLLRQYTTGQIGGYYGAANLSFDYAHMKELLFHLTTHIIFAYPYRSAYANELLQHSALVFTAITIFFGVLYRFTKDTFIALIGIGSVVSYIIVSIPFLQLLVNPANDGAERYTYLIATFFSVAFVCVGYAFIRLFTKKTWVGVFLLGMFLCIQIVFIAKKQAYWVIAGNTMKGIIASSQLLPSPENAYYIFIGLPDNIEGAEVARNAITQAISLETGRYIEGERIPLYTMFTRTQEHVVVFKQSGPHTFSLESDMPNEKRVFTGFPRFQHPLGDATLRNIILPEHSGVGIDMTLNPEAIDVLRQAGKQVFIVYYAQGALHPVAIN